MFKLCSAARLPGWSFALIAGLVVATCAEAEDAPPFPTDPAAWINSSPLSISGLKGKGIVLWFFDEESPKIRERWPAMIKSAQKFDNEPVVFIAVNSGTARGQLENYLQEMKVTWPVLVDSARDFEKACQMIQEVSPENESQIRYIKPGGEMLPGLTDDIDEAAKKAGEGAEWKMSPIGIPEPMKATWMAVEIGNYKGLSPTLKKSMSSSKGDVKDVGTKLMAIVQQEITDQMTALKEVQEAGNPYRAYEIVNGMSDHFASFELPKEVATLKKDLTTDAKVKAGIAAVKSLDAARKQLAQAAANDSGPKNKARDKAVKMLEKIVSDFPDTALA